MIFSFLDFGRFFGMASFLFPSNEVHFYDFLDYSCERWIVRQWKYQKWKYQNRTCRKSGPTIELQRSPYRSGQISSWSILALNLLQPSLYRTDQIPSRSDLILPYSNPHKKKTFRTGKITYGTANKIPHFFVYINLNALCSRSIGVQSCDFPVINSPKNI